MNVEIEETGPVERKLRIEVPTAEVDAVFDGVYHSLRKAARIPGFRKGKVPRAIMQRYFGERARADVLELLVRDSLARALDEADLDVVGDPRLDPGELPSEGEPYAYEATLDIRPTIELKQVQGLEVVGPELPEPEQDPVEAHLEELRVKHGQLVEESEGVAAARGHLAMIDYEATIEGRPFEGGSGKETSVELGEGRAIPGLEDEILGMTVGQEREFELSLPDSYAVAGAGGQPAHFRVSLLGIKRRELPDLDDEFAKDVSEHATLEELRADLQQRVDAARDRERDRLIREAVIEALIDANPFPVPAALVERQLESRMTRAASQLQQLPREEWRPRAERDVRLALLVPAISEAHDISVSEADLDEQLKDIAAQQGEPLVQLKRSYREQGYLDALRSGLLERRVVDFLVSEATVSDR